MTNRPSTISIHKIDDRVFEFATKLCGVVDSWRSSCESCGIVLLSVITI